MTDKLFFEKHPEPVTYIGKGAALVFSGYVIEPSSKIVSLEIGLNNVWQPVRYVNERREDLDETLGEHPTECAYFVGFWGVYVVLPIQGINRSRFHYRTTFANNKVSTGWICDCELINHPNDLVIDSVSDSTDPIIAICLATYQPRKEHLQHQIDSIRNQTYTNWICIVCDDASDADRAEMVNQLCSVDPRFHVSVYDTNVGFYANFERCLNQVPTNVDYVAFCDQDDIWYLDKLHRLLCAFTEETSLVYSDMRLIDESGSVLSDTYWTTRKNNCDDLHVLLAANTITGAASLFRREVLDLALPFPSRIGDAYHDHWIALNAFLLGTIKFISEPLYDYRQHDGNVIGHTAFERRHRTRHLLRLISNGIRTRIEFSVHKAGIKKTTFAPSKPSQRFAADIWYLLRLCWVVTRSSRHVFISPVGDVFHNYRVFFIQLFINQHRGLELFSLTLALRKLHEPGDLTTTPDLDAYSGTLRGCLRLITGWIKAKIAGKTTGNRELYMAISSLVYRYDLTAFICRRIMGR